MSAPLNGKTTAVRVISGPPAGLSAQTVVTMTVLRLEIVRRAATETGQTTAVLLQTEKVATTDQIETAEIAAEVVLSRTAAKVAVAPPVTAETVANAVLLGATATAVVETAEAVTVRRLALAAMTAETTGTVTAVKVVSQMTDLTVAASTVTTAEKDQPVTEKNAAALTAGVSVRKAVRSNVLKTDQTARRAILAPIPEMRPKTEMTAHRTKLGTNRLTAAHPVKTVTTGLPSTAAPRVKTGETVRLTAMLHVKTVAVTVHRSRAVTINLIAVAAQSAMTVAQTEAPAVAAMTAAVLRTRKPKKRLSIT